MGSAGTVWGKVTDPSGKAIPGATVELSNDLTLYRREVQTQASGEFQFANIPPNVYRLDINAPGFEQDHRDMTIRSAVPVSLEISLPLASLREAVTVRLRGAAAGLHAFRAFRCGSRTVFKDAGSLGRVRAQRHHHAFHSGRGGGLEWFLSSARRSRSSGSFD